MFDPNDASEIRRKALNRNTVAYERGLVDAASQVAVITIVYDQRLAFSSSLSRTSFIIREIVLRSTLNNSAISA
jgi:hypothetical protein